MPHIRLIGLVLFITTVFLAMAAVATQTTHIRFKRPTRDAGGILIGDSTQSPMQPGTLPSQTQELVLPPGVPTGSVEAPSPDLPTSELQFVAVPVIYPLLIAGVSGLFLWFVPAARRSTSSKRRRRRR